jgi:hypothetical protein
MFYTDYGRKPRLLPRIVRAFMDGSAILDLKLGKILAPSSISLDIAARLVELNIRKIETISIKLNSKGTCIQN